MLIRGHSSAWRGHQGSAGGHVGPCAHCLATALTLLPKDSLHPALLMFACTCLLRLRPPNP